ncbi:Uu.00g044380.m01.CDS01 [Anthostomella pinea]|uniref:Uu.00g044380.m01.CDS01 n=1 Tax=Anthostomella pinea TaxID=933095 RepID=A0AAI8YEA5_9PEZI|nr:Uu.00g044380.m01.CDS01 [Anthostomella pinea]
MASINAKPSLKIETSREMPPPPTTATPATENPKPILKLNTGGSRQPSISADGATPTPSTEKKTIKIKLNSQPSTPATATSAQTPSVMKTKAGRTSKPTAKLTESKKRGYESDEDRPMAASRASLSAARPSKMIKIKPSLKSGPNTPFSAIAGTPVNTIRFRPKGEPVPRKFGDAYDSEASDREQDPQRESNFILRVMDGPPTEYLKKALADGTMGVPKANGGAVFGVQFLDAKERRAMVTINDICYAAVLVRLPTITEAMKTWDRKAMMKNSDISEMLLCFAVVKGESEAKTIPLPPMVAKHDLRWPHGITPPMHDAANRRFRKTLSEKQWESTQNRVQKLIEDDKGFDDVTMDIINEDETENDAENDAEYDDEEDADGEADLDDYFGDQQPAAGDEDMDGDDGFDIDEDDLEAALEEELAGNESLNGATPAANLEAPPTPMTMDITTPAAVGEQSASEEDGDEDEDEDISEEDEDDDEDVDEEAKAAETERKQQIAELRDMERQLAESEVKLQTTTMPILQKRILSIIGNCKKEIAVKKAALGMADED